MNKCIFLFLVFIIATVTVQANDPKVLSSCESSLAGITLATTEANRTLLSEECYTRHSPSVASTDYTFLKWTGHWNNSEFKYLAPVTTWSDAVNSSTPSAINAAGWRLPTIKELAKLSKFGSHSITDDLSPVLANNWMIQQWLLRAAGDDGDGTDLLAKDNAYLLSSTYGIKLGATEMLMAINIHNGQIEALSADAFTASTVYVLKVKVEEPTWQVYKNDDTNRCLSSSGGYGSVVVGASCSSADTQKWLYEENTGHLRTRNGNYSGGSVTRQAGFCLWALEERGTGGPSTNDMKLGDCDTYSNPQPASLLVNGARWSRNFERTTGGKQVYSFGTSGSTGWHFYEENNANHDIEVYNYGGDGVESSDEDANWILQ